MSLARKILENTFVQVLGKLITAALSMVVLKIISGYLGTAGYGDYTTVYQYLAFFGIIADFGIYTITVKEMSRDERQIPMILGNIMGLRTLLIFVAMGLAIATVYFLPTYQGTLIPMGVLIATLATLFTLLNGTICSVLQVHLKMQWATISLVLGKVASVLYMLWAVKTFAHDPTSGFNQLLWSGVVGNAVNYAITHYYVRRFSPITYRFDFAFWKKVFVTSLPYGVALILSTVYFRLNVILMTFLLPHTIIEAGKQICRQALCSDTEIGLFGVAMRMLEMLVIIPIYFMNSVLPVMTRYLEEHSHKIRQLMQYSFDFLVATALPVLVGSFILAKPIIQFISDSEFVSGHTFTYGADVAIQFLMFAMVFSFVNSLFGFTLVALNKQTHLMFANGLALIVNLIGNYLLIPPFGFRGAAAISIASEVVILIYTYWKVQSTLGFHLSPKTLSRIVFSSLVMGLFVFLGYGFLQHSSHLIQLAVTVPLGGLIYIVMIFKSKAVTTEMMAMLKKTPQ
jgi:O-antigen/teichoic acid export membrane protein